MKKLIIFALMFTLAVGILPAQAKKTVKAPKPTVGKVVSLNEIYTGAFTTWSKETAKAAGEKGAPFVLLVGEGKKGTVYVVLNEDGTFAGKKLANYAFNKKVAVLGKTKTINGTKFIVAETIESME